MPQRDGSAQQRLFVVEPMTRGAHWVGAEGL